MANIIPGSPIAFEGMPADELLAGIVCLSPAIGGSLRDVAVAHVAGCNGNPFQYSFLENPRDGGAWWAAVYGVAQSQTRLKRLSSSSMKVYKTF